MNRTEIERQIELGEDDTEEPSEGAYVTVTIEAFGEYNRVTERVENIAESLEKHKVE